MTGTLLGALSLASIDALADALAAAPMAEPEGRPVSALAALMILAIFGPVPKSFDLGATFFPRQKQAKNVQVAILGQLALAHSFIFSQDPVGVVPERFDFVFSGLDVHHALIVDNQ